MRCLLWLLLAVPVRAEITVEADPRVELAGVVQYLAPASSDPVDFKRPEGAYGEALARFVPYKNHPAVTTLGVGVGKLSFAERAELMLRLSPPPGLRPRGSLPREFVDKAGGDKAVDAWLRELRDFAREADFDLAAPPAARLKVPRAALAKRAHHRRLEAYCGLAAPRQRLVLSPFLARGEIGHVLRRGPRGWDIATYAGLASGIGGKDDYWDKGLDQMLWHEGGHGVLDDLAALWRLDADARAPKDFKADACYGSWRQCVIEHVVNAVESRLMVAAYEEDMGAENKAPYFPYLGAMIARLEAYERDRRRYPTIAHFIGELIDVLPPAAGEPAPAARLAQAAEVYGHVGAVEDVARMLDAALAKGPSRELSRRRALLRAVLGDAAGARADAEAAGDEELAAAVAAYAGGGE